MLTVTDGVEFIHYNVEYESDTDRLAGGATWLHRDEHGDVACRTFASRLTAGRWAPP